MKNLEIGTKVVLSSAGLKQYEDKAVTPHNIIGTVKGTWWNYHDVVWDNDFVGEVHRRCLKIVKFLKPTEDQIKELI